MLKQFLHENPSVVLGWIKTPMQADRRDFIGL